MNARTQAERSNKHFGCAQNDGCAQKDPQNWAKNWQILTKQKSALHSSCVHETDNPSNLDVWDNFVNSMALDDKLGVLDQDIVY